jgi:hypothetical protein
MLNESKRAYEVGLAKTVLLSLAICSVQSSYALDFRCRGELNRLVVPVLPELPFHKKQIQTNIEDGNSGIYSVRLAVTADSPDNLDKEVTVGWVILDTNAKKAYDVSRDPDNKDELRINKRLYRVFVHECLGQ